MRFCGPARESTYRRAVVPNKGNNILDSPALRCWLFPGVYNAVTGPVRFQVANEDAERAREALEGIGASP